MAVGVGVDVGTAVDGTGVAAGVNVGTGVGVGVAVGTGVAVGVAVGTGVGVASRIVQVPQPEDKNPVSPSSMATTT